MKYLLTLNIQSKQDWKPGGEGGVVRSEKDRGDRLKS